MERYLFKPNTIVCVLNKSLTQLIMVILYTLGILITLILVIAAAIGTGWTYEKSIIIHAPLSKVWEHVKTLEALEKWSPWKEKDPNLKQEYTGEDGTPGAKYSWDSSNKSVGAGSQTIVSATEQAELTTRMDFIRPFKGTGEAYVRINNVTDGTLLKWGIVSSTPYPMNIIKLFGVIEKNMDNDFATGLNKLKVMCER
jgi:hypothetical protein